MTQPHPNLMASNVTVHLPEDPAAALLKDGDLLEITAAHPSSLLCWALLAEASLAEDQPEHTLAAYAYARTGYHRGLDSLRRNGWKDSGQVPWEHEPNRGFLRSLWALSVAAGRIGETDEQQRCAQFLRDSSETAYQQLAAGQG